ncbi:MAG: ornithine carbamoyltransferase [Candidatus Omnitrophica bacterium]|nr:ornithine carbamoyltransferase [Candidatus Omnitrophota bacterium]MBU1889452.1 ornithine carbamoyltransferase [Candidatus Omnitrophota bacterium]
MNKNLLSIKDINKQDINLLFQMASELKIRRKRGEKIIHLLDGKSLGLLFEKLSTRTRISFEIAIRELGGNSLFLQSEQLQLKRGETLSDAAKIFSLYLDALAVRTYNHDNLTKLAENSSIPVINALSDFSHPCQILSDMFTIKEKVGKLEDVKLTYIGAGNNVCNSLIYGSAKTGINLTISSPKGYEPSSGILEDAQKINPKCKIKLLSNPIEAVKNADVIYTDVWVSMGEEEQKKARLNAFRDFQINEKLVKAAKKHVLVMHCLPAHRGEEITSEVLDGTHSIVWEQAENKLHAQKALLVLLLGK